MMGVFIQVFSFFLWVSLYGFGPWFFGGYCALMKCFHDCFLLLGFGLLIFCLKDYRVHFMNYLNGCVSFGFSVCFFACLKEYYLIDEKHIVPIVSDRVEAYTVNQTQ